MSPDLKPGATASVEITVTRDMCPAFGETVVHEVYSTWSLAHHMELAARKVLAPHLEPHEEGIGSHLSIDHLAPTPLGHGDRVVATASEVEPTKLVCDISAYHVRDDGERLVARGVQVQRILPRKRLAALFEKARRWTP
jgi:predicted thioesterase